MRIGTSVPSAVVLSATPSSHHSASMPAACSTLRRESPSANETAQPPVPRTTDLADTRLSITSRPAKKKSSARPKLERKRI